MTPTATGSVGTPVPAVRGADQRVTDRKVAGPGPEVAVHARPAAYALLAGIALVWGGHWVVTKIGLESMPPFTYAVLRVVTGLATLLVLLAARGGVRVPDRRDVPIVLSVGLGQVAAGIALMNLALQVVPAGRSSILVYTMPLWVLVIGAALFAVRPTRGEALGLVLGLAGIVLLLNPAVIDWSTPGELAGAAALLLSAVIWAVTTIHVRRHRWHASPLALQPWQLAVAIVPLGLLMLALEPDRSIGWDPQTVLVILYSGPLATAFAFWASQSVTRSLGPLAATTGFLAVPMVGLAAGSIVLGEPLTVVDLAGFLLIVAGVAATSLGAPDPSRWATRPVARSGPSV
jgi:drug/metabolite transporter (DMT)-like permease